MWQKQSNEGYRSDYKLTKTLHTSPSWASYGVPDSKVHGANMGPTWDLSAPDGPHVGPMNLAIRGLFCEYFGEKDCVIKRFDCMYPTTWEVTGAEGCFHRDNSINKDCWLSLQKDQSQQWVCFSIMTIHLIRYGYYHYKDKTIMRPSYLYNENTDSERQHFYIEMTPWHCIGRL